MPNKRPIGVFDSGVGGLTVAKEIRRLMPSENIVYVGDTARVPYGTKTPETLLQYGREIIRFMKTKNAKAVVLACGTSSANTFDNLQEEFPEMPLMDVLRPGAEVCRKMIENAPEIRFGIIATSATINSGLFEKLLPNATLYSRACPLFASMVEAGLAAKPNHPLLHFAAETYLSDLRGKIDALVLGCTHYPLLTDTLAKILGEITFINLAESTAKSTKNKLIELNLLEKDNSPTLHEFHVSGSTEVFRATAQSIFNERCEPFKINF